jgi:hypothetical protein
MKNSFLQEVLESMESKVTNGMNEKLVRHFEAAKVDLALSQMQLLRSLGPDDFAACFYQQSWPLIGGEVSRVVLSFLNEGIFDNGINNTYIALIPKIKNPKCISEYRPISLCNVFYKLIAKVIANRLKKVLPSIISSNQSAFCPG